MCCDALVAAVNVGGISCLCQTAADLVVQNSMLNRTDLLRLYRECSGRHVPLEIYYGESLFSVPNMNLLLPRLSHNVFYVYCTDLTPTQPPPPPAQQVPPPTPISDGFLISLSSYQLGVVSSSSCLAWLDWFFLCW